MSEQGTTAQMMVEHGQFCWNELATSNIEASKRFYSEILGWTVHENENAGVKYYEFSLRDGKKIGGMWEITDSCKEPGSTEIMPSRWTSYVAVDNVDDSAAKVVELGGKICVSPMDIPNVGRFCVINDPSGATISLITLKTT